MPPRRGLSRMNHNTSSRRFCPTFDNCHRTITQYVSSVQHHTTRHRTAHAHHCIRTAHHMARTHPNKWTTFCEMLSCGNQPIHKHTELTMVLPAKRITNYICMCAGVLRHGARQRGFRRRCHCVDDAEWCRPWSGPDFIGSRPPLKVGGWIGWLVGLVGWLVGWCGCTLQ